MAGCVRHTTEDAIASGYRPIVVRETVGDRVPGGIRWNLFDIDAKFGDVESLERVLHTSRASSLPATAIPVSHSSRPTSPQTCWALEPEPPHDQGEMDSLRSVLTRGECAIRSFSNRIHLPRITRERADTAAE
jgi:hypothetical protein